MHDEIRLNAKSFGIKMRISLVHRMLRARNCEDWRRKRYQNAIRQRRRRLFIRFRRVGKRRGKNEMRFFESNRNRPILALEPPWSNEFWSPSRSSTSIFLYLARLLHTTAHQTTTETKLSSHMLYLQQRTTSTTNHVKIWYTELRCVYNVTASQISPDGIREAAIHTRRKQRL